jgi:GNAT superfamily N-acetyltransferase
MIDEAKVIIVCRHADSLWPERLYLLAMAVAPTKQPCGIGTRVLKKSNRLPRRGRRDAIRLDAYDAEAGAGRFYARCGYTEVGRVSYRNTPLIY